MDRPSLQVVIVNWNSGAQLKDCLSSFSAIANDHVRLARVTVVDNASTDGSADELAPTLPLVIIRNVENRGFAAACNQGAAACDADYLLFLNPDTQLMPGSLEGPAQFLQSARHQDVGIVGIQLFDANGRVARNTARVPTALTMMGHSIGLDRLWPSIFPPHFVTDWAHDETRVVDQVMGAFFFVRRTVFEAIGGFDERFFVYYEDLDFAVRARGRGARSVYLASAQAFHRGQGTTQQATGRRIFYFGRSKILFALKYFAAGAALGVVFTTLVFEPIMRVLASPRSAFSTLQAFGSLWKELPTMLRLSK